MKFIYKIFVILFLLTQITFAEVDLGLYVGGTNFTYSGAPPSDAEYAGKFGLTAALSVDFYLASHFALSLQPGIIQAGSRIVYANRFDDDLIDSTFYITQNSVNLPLNFKIFSPKRYFYFLGGMNFNYYFSNTIKKDKGDKIDIKEFLKDYDFSMNFGVAYQYFFPSTVLFIELRYTHGFQNLNTSNEIDRGEQPKYISNFKLSGTSLLIGVSYRFYSK